MAKITRDERMWLTCAEPAHLFDLFDLFDQERKARLWFVGCCRLDWEELCEESRAAAETAERFADGRAAADELARALATIDHVLTALSADLQKLDGELYEQCVAIELGGGASTDGIRKQIAEAQMRREAAARGGATVFSTLRSALYHWERHCHERDEAGHLLRCIFGNPFRPVKFDPAWRTDTVLALARAMYETREFFAMPILADALQDAGCDNDDILDHCRAPNAPHARGCWVVDQLLDRA